MSWNRPADKLEESTRFFEAFLGTSAVMRTVLTHIDDAAHSKHPVVIRGQGGTGKGLVAHMIHARSPRGAKPFVAVNVAALTTSLLERTLFGDSDRPGLLRAASGGSLLLDELDEIPPELMRRVFDEGNARLIGITSAPEPLPHAIERLRPAEFLIPPLRSRLEDLRPIATYFMKQHAKLYGISGTPTISPGAVERLCSRPWHRNLRELDFVIHQALSLGRTAELQEQFILLT